MTSVTARPSLCAPFTDEYWDRSAEVDAALQAESACVRATLPNGVVVWVISRYDEAREALTDPRLSKDAHLLTSLIRSQLTALGRDGQLSSMFGPHMLFRDDPAHARLRNLVHSGFTRGRAQRMRWRIEQITDQLLDDQPTTAPVDLIASFAFPLPLTVFGDLLGVPAADRPALRRWTTLLMQDREEITVPASQEMGAYLTELIAARRADPGDDLLSTLATAVVEGDRLSDDEVLGSAFLLVVAGHETTTNLLGNAVRLLLEQPDTWRAVGHDPDLLARVIEEALRVDSPVRLATHRGTIAPVSYGGVTIPAGEIVMVSLAAANRDPRRFTDPDRADWHREASEARGHLAFGHGIHHCLGAPLARLEAEIGLSGLARRFPQACLAVPTEELRHQTSAIMNGFQALPVLLDPR